MYCFDCVQLSRILFLHHVVVWRIEKCNNFALLRYVAKVPSLEETQKIFLAFFDFFTNSTDVYFPPNFYIGGTICEWS